MNVTMFIMVILSQAFVTGMDVFRDLKALGDMEDQLRAVSVMLRSDLEANHFGSEKRRLSDPYLLVDSDGKPRPLREGFFKMQTLPSQSEGVDSDGIPSVRTTAAGAPLHFSVL